MPLFFVAFASIATTIHWLPKLFAPSLIKSGFKIADEFMETLSAPANKSFPYIFYSFNATSNSQRHKTIICSFIYYIK